MEEDLAGEAAFTGTRIGAPCAASLRRGTGDGCRWSNARVCHRSTRARASSGAWSPPGGLAQSASASANDALPREPSVTSDLRHAFRARESPRAFAMNEASPSASSRHASKYAAISAGVRRCLSRADCESDTAVAVASMCPWSFELDPVFARSFFGVRRARGTGLRRLHERGGDMRCPFRLS